VEENHQWPTCLVNVHGPVKPLSCISIWGYYLTNAGASALQVIKEAAEFNNLFQFSRATNFFCIGKLEVIELMSLQIKEARYRKCSRIFLQK